MLVHDMCKNSVLLEWRFAETEAAGLEDIYPSGHFSESDRWIGNEQKLQNVLRLFNRSLPLLPYAFLPLPLN